MSGLVLAFAALATAQVSTATLQVELSGVRDQRGTIHACLTQSPAHFPDCKSDPAAIMQTIPGTRRELLFRGVAPGRYALAVFHDENANRKLDTFLGIPREGFGFSRNPTIRFGAPRFDKVTIELAPGFARTSVRLQYLL
jgi:uncharacterized protein (DUF2141 family)